MAVTARQERPEALQGLQSPNLLFVLDEASGIPDIVFEVASGALTRPGALVVMCGNPTRLHGYFHRAFHANRALWHTAHVPISRSTINVEANQRYTKRMEEEWGRDSNTFRIRVLGEFPTSEANGVIPLDLIEAARGRNFAKTPVFPIWGIDVADQGEDDSALVIREGNYLIGAPHIWHHVEPRVLAGKIIRLYEDTPNDMKPSAICIDAIGLGNTLWSHLKDDPLLGDIVHKVNVAESPAASELYPRLRDELWFKGREWFQNRDCCLPKGPPDGPSCPEDERKVERLIGELSRVTFDHASNGKLKVQSKDDMKRDGNRSPDCADAFLHLP